MYTIVIYHWILLRQTLLAKRRKKFKQMDYSIDMPNAEKWENDLKLVKGVP
jgi:hypothetical protein